MEEYALIKCNEIKEQLRKNIDIYMELVISTNKNKVEGYLLSIGEEIAETYLDIENVEKLIKSNENSVVNISIFNCLAVRMRDARSQEKRLLDKNKNKKASDNQISYIEGLLKKNEKYALQDKIYLGNLKNNQAKLIISVLKGEADYNKEAEKLLKIIN